MIESQKVDLSKNFEDLIAQEYWWNALTICVLAKVQGFELKVSAETALKSLHHDRTTGIDKRSNRKVVLNLDAAEEFLRAVIDSKNSPAQSLLTQIYGPRSQHFQGNL